MIKTKYGQKIAEIAGFIQPTRKETPRQRMLRLYPHLVPAPEQIERVKREIGIASFGSPGIREDFNTLVAWTKAHWPWLLGGGVLYSILLAACLKKE